jgi:hypothetical protein
VKNILLTCLMLCALCSCQKMAVRHTCTCEVKRNVNGVVQELGSISKNQIGTYSRASDSCTKLQDGLNYTAKTTEGVEIHTAECEIN